MNRKEGTLSSAVRTLRRKMTLAKPSVRLMVLVLLFWLEFFAITGHCSKVKTLKGKNLRVVAGHVRHL